MSKLTLSIKPEIIERAKSYEKAQGRSLSNIIEEYLKSVTHERSDAKQQELAEIIKELKGSIKISKHDKSYKEILEDALIDKYINQ